jgi:hypothetical protein
MDLFHQMPIVQRTRGRWNQGKRLTETDQPISQTLSPKQSRLLGFQAHFGRP